MKIGNQLLKNYDDAIDVNREDLKIFSIVFKNLEGEYACMEIITNAYVHDFTKICLSYGERSFFKGKFLKNPEPVNEHLTKLFYVAKNEDYGLTADEENFFKNAVFSDFSLPRVHPVTHEKSTICYFTGSSKEPVDLTSLILSDSFGIEIFNRPIKKLRLELIAKWIQNSTGIFDIFPFIKSAFPAGHVETLTGMNFQSSFPTVGKNLGNNFQYCGYSVLYANLQTTNVQKYFLNAAQGTIQIPHYTFKGKLFVEWTIFFKRCETINVYILYDSDKKYFDLSLNDQDCDHSVSLSVNEEKIDGEKGAFFNTLTGNESVNKALFQACYKMMRSHFTSLIHIKVPFSQAVNLQCGDCVVIYYDQQRFEGIISSIYHTISGTTAETKISFFSYKVMLKKNEIETFVKKTLKNMTKILQAESDPFENLENVAPHHFLEKVSVFNAACEQKNILDRLGLKDLKNVRQCLKKHPTVVDVQFKDLRNKTIKEKKYSL